MQAFKVKLTESELPLYVQSSFPVVFEHDSATLHIPQGDAALQTISRCARRLTGMIQSDAALVGEWNFEQQWAFASGFGGPKSEFKTLFSDSGRDSSRDAKEQASSQHELQKLQNAVFFARELINQTPEQLSPELLATEATKWLSDIGKDAIKVKSWVGDELQQAGWQGIYEVGRGSERPPVLLEVDYNPSGDEMAAVDYALVGKGITFDSGGYSIKGSEGMLDMKCDMGGAATVTSALGLAITQGLQKRIKLFLCCAENLISGHAYKLGDIITYKNGTTVEIVNTDAEGRLVLADGLIAATESGAKRIIDAATLTGAVVMALGRDYNGIFSRDDALADSFLKLSETVNEPHWRLPLTQAHMHKCPSPFADTANSRPQKGGGAGGASNAAGFLSRFVNEEGKGWLHIDLAAAYNREGNDTMPSGGTGLGIRSIAAMLFED